MAEHGLSEIQHLYKIEYMCDDAGLSPDERKAKRQELALPIMEAMKLWMETEDVKYSESSLTGKTITYAYTRWDNVMRYFEDGRLLLDNNLAENEIRPITLGERTTSSAVTTRQHKTCWSSAHYWQHAGTTMSIRGITSTMLSVCHIIQKHHTRNFCNCYRISGN